MSDASPIGPWGQLGPDFLIRGRSTGVGSPTKRVADPACMVILDARELHPKPTGLH
jgi:hypothetical protein